MFRSIIHIVPFLFSGGRLGWVLISVTVSMIRAGGATATWTGLGGSPSWDVAANWSSGTLPGRDDSVVIPGGSGPIDFRAGNYTIQRLTAPDGLHLRGGVLTLIDGESRVGGSFVLEE